MKNQIFIEFELLAQKQVIGFERSLMKVLQTRDSDRIDEIWEKEIYDDRYYNRMCVCVWTALIIACFIQIPPFARAVRLKCLPIC